MLFFPKKKEMLLVFTLFPLSIIYCIITFLNSYRKHLFQIKYPETIIGVGNLVLGGTGKTPFLIALAKNRLNSAIILRGYGRNSKGLILVSLKGMILTDVSKSGDEAMLYAEKLQNTSVIVSENRELGIKKAQEIGVETIFLDDSYRQHNIYKNQEYLIESDISNILCLPAGGYRERLWFFKKNIIFVKDGVDFKREVWIESPTKKMVLITAISKPHRLHKYISKDIPKYEFPDHYNFNYSELLEIVSKEKATSILTTEKDFVKMKNFNFQFSLIKLEVKLKEGI